jgi:hypothetical protein
MSRSIIKQTRPHPTIDIHSIFSSTKSSNPKINHLTAELSRLRSDCKKTQLEIKSA